MKCETRDFTIDPGPLSIYPIPSLKEKANMEDFAELEEKKRNSITQSKNVRMWWG